jgi:hypothetical protein
MSGAGVMRARRGYRALCGGLVLGAAACVATTPGESASAVTSRESRVGGAVWPEALASAPASPGVALLRPPPPPVLARRAVQGFFDAVRQESVGQLSMWLAEDATLSSGRGTSAESIAKVWAARFKQLDYGYSGAKQPFRADDVGLFSAGQLEALGRARRFELAPAPNEVLAVVDTRDRRRVAGPRHFGKRLEFLLAPTPEGYRIRRMFEDFRLP